VATYNLYDAKNSLSDLVERAVNGEEVVIARRNVPAVRMVPVVEKPTPEFGRYKHMGRVTDEFFEPLPDEETEGLG
jgi:prevent-host-death family protein